MFDDKQGFLTRPFLRSVFEIEFQDYAGEEDSALRARLTAWSNRRRQKETSAEAAFLQAIFVDVWGYQLAGGSAPETLRPKFAIKSGATSGATGQADAALGRFSGRGAPTPQVLCEFKDERGALDQRVQKGGIFESPVQQCLRYVRAARSGLVGNELVQPWWALVTDMNEFRLYWWDRAPQQFLKFTISAPIDLLSPYDLTSDHPEAAFDRFLFSRLFRPDQLLADAGRPLLLRLVDRQWTDEEKLEDAFYSSYRAVRERLFGVVRTHNPDFPDGPAQALRTTQKLLDRFIFAFYCEDMGQRMLFPPQFLRDYLRSRSVEPFFDPSGYEIWDFFRKLFATMDAGGKLGQTTLPRINGGLFLADPLIDTLRLPNDVFVAPRQGESPENLDIDPQSLFYLSARYNFAASGNVRDSVTLYTLGRIFEQSITELEYKIGKLENRPTIAEISKRKRDGVYYTPEWIVTYLVRETLDPWFEAARTAAGWPAEGEPSSAVLSAYRDRVRGIRIVDPACGSGAFLIAAFRRLLDERIEIERQLGRVAGREVWKIDEKPLIADILERNLYGVDLNPSSVEIAKLALWLHSARADAPLSSLDHTLRSFNSLIGPEFWVGRKADDAKRDQVNATISWRDAFPEVWPAGAPGGFDIVLGNPPYVKLQNLRKLDSDVAEWLQADRGARTYESAQTGNFDLYLPFIELGLDLLAPCGQMAYIAPSLWPGNEYGEGLRRRIHRERQLERWLDFKSFQVFEDVTTYTALQFYTHAPQATVKVAAAPDGKVENVDWSDPALALSYDALAPAGPWVLATGAERALIDRLARDCLRLDDPLVTTNIFVGVQTSDDKVYHLRRLAPGVYETRAVEGPPERVEIEDALMKPLVSGPEAKRYETPRTDTYILFPYARTPGGRMELIPAERFAREFPRAWAYLRRFEARLRGREKGKMDREGWWGYVYPKNLHLQSERKLLVPRLVQNLKAATDQSGTFHLDNVDVGGVAIVDKFESDFVCACLNSKPCTWVFRLISKSFSGDYRSANRQFIAPLPIPDAPAAVQAEIAARAQALQRLWTERCDLIEAAERRLDVVPRARHPEAWLWPDLPSLDALIAAAPKALATKTERRAWAKAQATEAVAARLERLAAAIGSGGAITAEGEDGELRLRIGGIVALDRVFVAAALMPVTLAYWRFLLIKDRPRDAKSFAAALRAPPATAELLAAEQFLEKVAQLLANAADLERLEGEMEDRLAELYGLTEDERALVYGG